MGETKTCKCGAGVAFDDQGVCHKCGHPVVDGSTGKRRQAALSAHEVKRQSRAREYRKDPDNLADGHAYMAPIAGDARPR
jgi:hypothetical protein